jgi:peptidyl-prolyl cis-trans isomerase C
MAIIFRKGSFMRRFSFIRTTPVAVLSALSLSFLVFTPLAFAADTVVAKVDGMEITEQDIAVAAEDLAEAVQQMPEEKRRDYYIAYLADLRLASKAAREAKLDENAEFKRRMAYRNEKVLLEEYLAVEARKLVTEASMRALYDESVKQMKPEPEIRARHILVETEDAAKAVVTRLKAGEDFAKVAGEVSKDPGSGAEGGDLGYFTKERMVPEFSTAAFAMKVGDVSDPVKSQFGFHVIKVEDIRERPIPGFDEVKGQIEQYLIRKSQQDAVMALRAKAKIERVDTPAQ